MKSLKFFFLVLLMASAGFAAAQVNLMGKPGLMTIPSGAWFGERELGFSFGYVPQEYGYSINAQPIDPVTTNTLNFYNVRAGLTKWMDVNFTICYRPKRKESVGIGDRQLDVRFRLHKETEKWPGIVIGITPPGSEAPDLGHDYLALTKSFETKIGKLSFTGGYGSPYILVKQERLGKSTDLRWVKKKEYSEKDYQYLVGVFYGVTYQPVDFAGLMFEYNSSTYNVGVFAKVKEWLHVQVYSFEGKSWAFSLAGNFSLDFKPKELRKYEKGG
ncbi:YjbH domain-containing protein [Echinicola sp. CAU 1574]|uniref:YjbH domain-containing protein n=1 Tax=Echinicola arenosa TaxID=2774144 RepID=A0ABR9AR09_9BACT|nr:YjbH domain-containing protein [Echinicola arenosa]MBD8490054.1 YjbH domain-containing protein [Echinicola arenosa]